MKKGMVQEQIEIASASLNRRRKFEAGWYDDRIAELEADLKKLRTDFCAVVSEREQLKQEFSAGVELLEKVLASLGVPK